MNKKKILLFLFPIFLQTFAQQKQGIVWSPHISKYAEGISAVDSASIRFYYAWNAEDKSDTDSYLDLGMLQIGRKFSKYSSSFVAHSDSLVLEWHRTHSPNAAYPSYLEMKGRMDGYWSEYQYSEIFVKGNELTEWAVAPRHQEKNCARYTEPYPLMKWTLSKETMEICGHKCQKATCHFRGRDFIAWFAPDIPIRKGPWKFGGLPGLILKVYDTKELYTFECVKIEKGLFPMSQFSEKIFPIQTREKVYKFQVRMNENWAELSGYWASKRKDHYDYDPLELE